MIKIGATTMSGISGLITKMPLGAVIFSSLIFLAVIFHQEIIQILAGKVTIKIGEHEFQVEKYERKF